jgi:hypothetical protein
MRSHILLEVSVAHERLMARPQQLSPAQERSLGLPPSGAPIGGSIIGVVIFSLPYSLASYLPSSILAMASAALGAGALALIFAAAFGRLPLAYVAERGRMTTPPRALR